MFSARRRKVRARRPRSPKPGASSSVSARRLRVRPGRSHSPGKYKGADSRHFLNCQQHKLQAAGFLVKPAGVDDQGAFAEFGEFVFEPEVADFALSGQILLEQLPEPRDVPLPVVQVEQGFVLDLLRTDMEGAAESVVYATDLELGVEGEQWLAGEGDDMFDGALEIIDIGQDEDDTIDAAFAGAIGADAERVPAALVVLDFAVDDGEMVDDIVNGVIKIRDIYIPVKVAE